MNDEAKDPVCGMVITVNETTFRSTFEGKTYYFCSQQCRDQFDKEPQQYVKHETDCCDEGNHQCQCKHSTDKDHGCC